MRTQRTHNSPSTQSGFGLIAWLELTRVALPLKGVECRFEVTGSVASVELDQVYHQNASKPLDCTYTFPLPAGAAVHRCEVHINGRIIRAKVEEKGAAREMYRLQKAAGRRAALVEMERENLFTLSLGNVQPGDVVVVCFAWFQVLDRLDDGLRLMVPTCPGIRYIPGKPLLRALSGRGAADDTDQVPDASRISPPRIDALHPDAAYFCITGRLSAVDVESGTASSPSHSLLVREAEGSVGIGLSSRGDIPDRDFVLTWKEPKALQLVPQSWHWREGEETYALVQLHAPADVKVADHLSQDFYFLVDRSGSMGGVKWTRTCEALHGFVGLLGATDRVWITLFESTFQDFDAAPIPAPQVLADAGFQKMVNLGVAGGTELLPAAEHVLAKITEHSAGRRTSMILITDGEVGNDGAILQAFRTATGVTVHTFGIDTTVNDAFLKSLAQQQRGGCWLQTPDDDIAGTVSGLGDRLRRPVLTDLTVKGSWETGDGSLHDLHAKEIATVALRGHGAIEVSGRLPDGSPHSFPVGLGAAGSEAVKLLWAKRRIESLLASGKSQAAISLAKIHNLICAGAAFIAWDEQEQVAVAKDEVVQPAMEPEQDFAAHFHCGRVSPAMRYLHSASIPDSPFSLLEGISFDDLPALALDPSAARVASELLNHLLPLLRDAMQRARIPDPVADQYVAWVRESDPVRRTMKLGEAMNFLASVRQSLGSHAALEEHIQRLIGHSPEAVVEWVARSRSAFETLSMARVTLEKSGLGGEQISRILEPAVVDGEFDHVRIGQIQASAQLLIGGPFSARARERQLAEMFGQAAVSTPA